MSRERTAMALLIAAAVAAATWIAFHTVWTEVTLNRPPRGAAARDPYYGVAQLAQALGVRTRRTASLRALPPSAAVLLIADARTLRKRLDAIERWTESGGRLVVAGGAIATTPELRQWTGIALAQYRAPSQAPRTAADAKARMGTGSVTCDSLTVRANGNATGERLQLCLPWQAFGFTSTRVPQWDVGNERGLQLLRVTAGAGSVAVIGPQALLAPQTLVAGDDAQAFFAAVPMRRGDLLVILDQASAEPLLALLWRLAAPAIIALSVAAALAIARLLPRFGSPVPMPVAARRSLAEQLRATAQFAWRTGHLDGLHRAALLALERTARARVAGFDRMDTTQRTAALARRAGCDAGSVRAAMGASGGGDRNARLDAILVLERTRRALRDAHHR